MAVQRQKRLENQMLCYDGIVRKKVEHRREDQRMVIIEKPRVLPPVLTDAERMFISIIIFYFKS